MTDWLDSSGFHDAWSADAFSDAADVWKRLLSDHLRSVLAGETPVLNWEEPDQAIPAAEEFLGVDRPPGNRDELLRRFRELVSTALAHGQNLHHPHYIGHQVPAPVPLAGLFDAVGAVTNQVMAIWEMGPWATAVEQALIRTLCRRVGWAPDSSSGVLTHGGSLANLTALLTARNVSLPDSWERGVPQNAVLVAHADAHYCVTRSAGILGLGTQQVVRAALDPQRRMCANQLEATLREVQAAGRTVIAVSACACATPVGAFDPLDAIADVCRRYGVWLHVDAAHGGSVLLSRRHRDLLRGIEAADSVVWDAHKMLFVPALCTAVLYRDRAHRFETFRQDAPYLFDPSAPGMAEFDSGMRTIECTKRATGFGLWGVWSLFGDRLFERLVDRVFALGQTLYELLSAADDFEALHEPECNIVVFRHLPAALRDAPPETVNRFQRALRSRLIRSGEFYIVQTQLDDRAALRVAVMNPVTTRQDLEELLESLRDCAAQILSDSSAGW